MSISRGWWQVLVATAILAVVSTLADVAWSRWALEHRAALGLAHGGTVLAAVGAVLGGLGGSWRLAGLGGVAGLLVGLLAAGLFYVLYGVVGTAAMLVSWFLLWIAFAFLDRFLGAAGESPGRALARGAAAAFLSGLAFYLFVVAGIWHPSSPSDPTYLRHLASWAAAFLPGFAALRLGTSSAARGQG